ncbi:MAG: aldose 1-epimerase family protein [Verrucomicrobia bacterium]|nr:aldose 1-epimerase family protein [Verrucomicrobiota bacterium]
MVYKKVLTDSTQGFSLKEWRFDSTEAGDDLRKGSWSITKSYLAGGRQEGTEIVEIDNGALKFVVVPTRGMSIWRAEIQGIRLGWDSPVTEIVHPNFVDLTDRGGKGWLNGFGEWLSRCGLESMGPPGPDGAQVLMQHGRINYLPANYLELRFEREPTPRIVLRGTVDESFMFGPHLRLTTEISTEIGSGELVLNDTVTNLADVPQEMESLYHINFGPPLLGAGARFVAPIKRVAPRDARAAEVDMAKWNLYVGSQPAGYTEQVYFAELWADQQGSTQALLQSPDAKSGALVAFNAQQLPYFTLWKNEAPLKTGYVTGLEPATSYPFHRSVERKAGRLLKLPPGGTHDAKVAIKALLTEAEVNVAIQRINELQREEPHVETKPMDEA